MNPLLLLALIPFFKDSFQTFFKNKAVQVGLIAIAVYYFYNNIKGKETTAQIDNNALSGSNQDGYFSALLFDALHPYFKVYVPFVGYPPDGTDETAITNIGKQMKPLQNWSSVAEAYKLKYGVALVDDLTSDGVLELFKTAYNGTTTVIKPKATTTTTVNNTGSIYIAKGNVIRLKQGWNVRNNSGTVNHVSVLNESHYVSGIYQNKTIGGTLGTWILTNNNYWININAVNSVIK